MSVTHNGKDLVARLQARIEAASQGSPQMRAALTRIGLMVASQTILNVRNQRLIDTGRLINSIRYELFSANGGAGVRIGSFGVPYAAVHEFGYQGPAHVRAHTRRMTQAFGRNVEPREISVGPHTRFLNIRKRPYLRPAVRKHQSLIIDLIREALGGKA